jgi:hypothetical protein
MSQYPFSVDPFPKGQTQPLSGSSIWTVSEALPPLYEQVMDLMSHFPDELDQQAHRV